MCLFASSRSRPSYGLAVNRRNRWAFVSGSVECGDQFALDSVGCGSLLPLFAVCFE